MQKLAKAEAECIASYYGVKKKGENTFTEIMGNAVATMEQMTAYIKAKNPDVAQSVIDMIPLYLSEGKAEGVRGDIAFAQSCLETGNFGFFGSAVTLDQNNFCGMGVTSNGMRGNSFDTPQLGIRAQVQHLKAYASTVDLKNECVDPRFKYVTRGCAEYVEWLGQKENPDGRGWAAGAGYGAKIITILNTMIGIKNETTEPEEVWYRVRKTWTDAATQKGAFHSLETLTLKVQAVFPYRGVSKAYIHEVTVRDTKDGGIQYVGNRIIEPINNPEIRWHVPRLTRTEWEELYGDN